MAEPPDRYDFITIFDFGYDLITNVSVILVIII